MILAKTIKGYGLGEAAEGKNTTHQQKKLDEESLRKFRDRFEIPISDEDLKGPLSIGRRREARKPNTFRSVARPWGDICRPGSPPTKGSPSPLWTPSRME